MSTADTSGTRQAAIATFDATRDDFLAAFAEAPDGALTYLPPGDEYTLGVLPRHLCDSMDGYLDTLDQIERAGYGPVDLAADPQRAATAAERHRALVAARPADADRPALLDELRATHDRVRQRALGLDAAAFARQAPVVYALGADPYPTSCRDILGWLSDHYAEHVAQVRTMLAEWRAGGELTGG